MTTTEQQIEQALIAKLGDLKYTSRPDIRDRASLEANFREKFQQLNRVNFTDEEFARLLEEIVTPDVFTAAQLLRTRNSFIREDGTPLNYTLVNIDDWCKNSFEVINQLRIREAKRLLLSTDFSISKIASDIGFDNISYFSTVFRKQCGVSPADWRNRKGSGDTDEVERTIAKG